MYKASLSKCVGQYSRLEATALCNYASFLCKYRHDFKKAEPLFVDGMNR